MAGESTAGSRAASTPALEIDHIGAGYGEVAVVRDLSISVDAGEVVALLGPNGAGKTTTLLSVSGVVRPTRGAIRVGGSKVVGMRPDQIARAGVAHVPEGRGLFYGLTVAENLRVGLSSRSDIEWVTDLLPELGRLMHRQAGLLSGGEQQMLSLGRALGRHPKLLLLDEMSLGLAPVIVEKLLSAVHRLAKETGTGVLIVEQHVALVLEVSDRAYVLVRGALVLTGRSAELLDRVGEIQASYLGDSAIAEQVT
ncbi:ABC transporter ATP-binding protein [Pseudonocardia sp.]|jgi:branched-chain amino acid transport system ATP-binding protein|uniref:ABC transporter ATP-binding protein n=1 Tax=Pseudonocardia sp. TaxID=60912 RepID=UPI0031FCAAEB